MDALTLERANLESELHQALKLKQLELHYQPKVDTATGDVRSAEARLSGGLLTVTVPPLKDRRGRATVIVVQREGEE